LKILLIGNYAPDAQESMRRYAELLRTGLLEAGHEVTLAEPRNVLNRSGRSPTGIWKWIGYVDKYVLNLPQLHRAAQHVDVVHVCDHSNSVYVPTRSKVPYVVTCHDLLAVRGSMGEDTDCPASFAGRQLQKAILRGLRRAHAVSCDSGATLRDAERLLSRYSGELIVAPIALHYPYRVLARPVVQERLAVAAGIGKVGAYVLNVGSNLRRKNREAVIRGFATAVPLWDGKLVFAGQRLSGELRRLAEDLGVINRIVEITKPSNEFLEALYNGALALLFPSRFEGFGWPIVEAQSCGCPVICSDREPLPEVAGDAAIKCAPDDHVALGNAVVALANHPEKREELIRRGLVNARRYDRAQMISRFVSLYEQLAMAA
jgi:glycosyltransferase involved in cell wall biosynthesis